MRILRRIIAASAVIAATAACASVEEIIYPTPAPGANAPVTFTASVGVPSKTAIDGELNVGWSAGDRITVFDALGKSEEFTVDADCDSYSFTSTGTIGAGPYYAVAGYGSDGVSFDKDNGQIGIARPSAVTDGSFGSADLIASSTSGTSFTFHHVFALLKMSVASDDITSLTFAAGGIAAAGTTLIGFSEDGGIEAVYDNGGDEVTVEDITGPGTFYVAVNPGTYENGFTIYVQREQTRMMIESDKAFTASTGKIVNFGTLDTGTPASTVWSLVTNANTLSAGDEIIITALDSDLALGKQKGSGRAAAPVVKSRDGLKLVEIGEEVQILTLTNGTVSGTFGLYTGQQYLHAASSYDASLKTQTRIDQSGSWYISTVDGIASFRAQANSPYNAISFNDAASVFSCYSPVKSGISIYKKFSTEQQGPQLIDINAFLDEDLPGAYSYDASQNTATPLFQFTEGRDQLVRGEGSIRFQNLSMGHLAGITLPLTDIETGGTYAGTVMLYGLDGFEDGVHEKTFIARKVQAGKAWLQEDNGPLSLIILIR